MGAKTPDHQGFNFESCVWRAVSSPSYHHPQEVLLAKLAYMAQRGPKTPSFFHFIYPSSTGSGAMFAYHIFRLFHHSSANVEFCCDLPLFSRGYSQSQSIKVVWLFQRQTPQGVSGCTGTMPERFVMFKDKVNGKISTIITKSYSCRIINNYILGIIIMIIGTLLFYQ